jgi:ABC-2 type transport system permease protein
MPSARREVHMEETILMTREPTPVSTMPVLRVLRLYALEAWTEFLKTLRLPHYSGPVLAIPVMFYLLFGLSFGGRAPGQQIGPAEYLLASYSVFGVVTAALFAFGAGVAMERAQGWLPLKRATPMPISAYLLAKVASSMLFGIVIVILMAFCAIVFGHVRFPVATWLGLAGAVVIGCIPFCLAGLLIAFAVPPQGAPGIVNLINLPLAFAGGLWLPVSNLPAFFRSLAPFVPQYHLGQLALAAIGAAPAGDVGWHVSMLLVMSLLFGVLALIAWRRADETRG